MKSARSCAFPLLALVAALGMGQAAAQHHHHGSPGEAAEASNIKRRTVAYVVPSLSLVRQDGRAVDLREELAVPGPVFVNFIFTSCTTVCPLMSQIFAGLHSRLGDDAAGVRLVSVSIDPLEDTPARLSSYARQFGAGASWHFLTGTVEASIAAQRAFDVYRGDKMNHPVATFFRRSPESPWVRIEGFPTPEQLRAELHNRD